MEKKLEGNIIIAINAMKKIMVLFLGPFLTAYFIKTSQESIVDLSIYYIFSYILLAIGSFIVASIIKNRFRIGMFRIGVILNFFYILGCNQKVPVRICRIKRRKRQKSFFVHALCSIKWQDIHPIDCKQRLP